MEAARAQRESEPRAGVGAGRARERIVEPQRASVDQRRRDQRRDDEARRVRELERWENKQRAAAAERKRRVEAARPPNNGAARRGRRNARARRTAPGQRRRAAGGRTRARGGGANAREGDRARDNDAARRDRAREAERARQREIVEKLKADKLELDEAEARRQARVRQAAAAERRRAEADLLREQEEAAERRRVEAELLREQERRLAARLEAAKKAPPASPRVAEAKNLHDPSLAAKHAFSPRNDGLNARDRVLMRKRAAQEARERELNQALAEARQESAEQAQQAKAWGDAQYRSSMDSKLPRRPPATPPRSPEAKVASPTRWASPSPRRPAASPSPRRPPMTPDTPEPRRLTPDTPPQCPPTRDGPPTRDDDVDLVLDSESEDEEAAIGFAVAAPEHIEDAEQDIQKREDELRAELELTSQRCEELRKSLHDTKARMAARDAAPVEEDESEDEGPAVGVLNAVVEEDESDDEAPVRVVPPQSPPRVLESPRTPIASPTRPSPGADAAPSPTRRRRRAD